MDFKTPFMEQYYRQQRNGIDDEIYAIQRGKDPHKRYLIENLEVAFRIAEESLKRLEVIIVGDEAKQFLDNWIMEDKDPPNEPPIEWHFPDSSQIGFWIELETPMREPGVPFDIKVLQFTQVAKNGLDILNINIPDYIREKVNKEQREHSWVLDVISTSHRSEFELICKPQRKMWAYNDEHRCPYGTCNDEHGAYRELFTPKVSKDPTKVPVCSDCRTLAIISTVSTALFLGARRGEFQEIEYREAPAGKGHSQNRSVEGKDVPEVIVSKIDIKKRTIYTKPETEQPGDPRPHWKDIHSEEEIEAIKKAARKHVRKYKDGREVEVKQSRPRNYWRLKSERITILD